MSCLTKFGYAAVYRENITLERELLCLIDVSNIDCAWLCQENVANLPPEMVYKVATDFLYSCISSIEKTDPSELRIQRLQLTFAQNETTFVQNVEPSPSSEREYDNASDDGGSLGQHMRSTDTLKASTRDDVRIPATLNQGMIPMSQWSSLAALGSCSNTILHVDHKHLVISKSGSLATPKNRVEPPWNSSSTAEENNILPLWKGSLETQGSNTSIPVSTESGVVKLEQDSMSDEAVETSPLIPNQAAFVADSLLKENLAMSTSEQTVHSNAPRGEQYETMVHIDKRRDKRVQKRERKKKSKHGRGKEEGDETENKCDVCSMQLSTKSSLANHMRIHTGERPFQCETCGKAFAHWTVLANHKKSHTGERPFTCTTCGKTFTVKRYLVEHRRTHTGERPYRCQMCGNGFYTKGSLKKHGLVHTKEKPHECHVCGKRFAMSFNRNQHLTVHGLGKTSTMKCDLCDKTYKQSTKLEAHRKTHTGEKPYLCHLCGKCFSSTNYFWQHRKIHDETKYHCPNCGRNYSWAHTLRQHLKTCVEKQTNS